MSQQEIEQKRIRQIIYLNLDRLFEELDDLSQQKIEKEAGLKKEKREVVKNFAGPGKNSKLNK